MAKDAQAEMITIGLKDEGGMVDEASGNEVPNGALKEEVRDDQPAMLSPGEFVIPAYAVRYIGVERLVSILREAKQGMEQLDDIGLTGEPNADDAGLETAVLPSEMQEEGGMPKLAVGGFPTINPGAVTRTALTNQPTQQQFGVAPPAAISPVMQPNQPTTAPAFGTAPSPLTQQMYRPTAPIRSGQQNITYPEFQYSPTPGGTGYGVEEYVGPDGQAIFVTTIGGKPISKIPEGYLTRAAYTKKQEESTSTITTPPTELQRKPEQVDGDAGIGEPGEPDSDFTEGNTLPTVMTPAFAALANWAYGKNTNMSVLSAGMGLATGGPVGLLTSLVFQAGGKAIGRGIVSRAMSKLGEPKAGKKYTPEEVSKFITEMGDLGEQSIDSDASEDTQITVDENTQESAVFDASGKPQGGFFGGRTTGDPQSIPIDTSGQNTSRTTISPAEAAAIAITQGTANAGIISTSAVDTSGGYADTSGGDPSAPGDDGGGGGYGSGVPDADGFGGMDGIGRAEGGLITVGNKTYKPEDFGFANKGTFVTKKKTRKRNPKGKGLASK